MGICMLPSGDNNETFDVQNNESYSKFSKKDKDRVKDSDNFSILISNINEGPNYQVRYKPSSMRKLYDEQRNND